MAIRIMPVCGSFVRNDTSLIVRAGSVRIDSRSRKAVDAIPPRIWLSEYAAFHVTPSGGREDGWPEREKFGIQVSRMSSSEISATSRDEPSL